MLKYIVLLLALCLPVVAAENDKPETPRIYNDSWLNIQYCDVKDVLAYEGADAKFKEIKSYLENNKYKYGILIYSNSVKSKSGKFKISDYLIKSVILKIDKSRMSNIEDFQKWLKSAKGEKSYSFSYSMYVSKLSKTPSSFSWILPEKPKEYIPES